MADPNESKVLESAFDSPTFGEGGSFRLDKPVGSASISPCGRDVVLASRQGLHIIDLDSPWSPPRHLRHTTPWEVADVQWSPFAARDYWVVSTSNQKALVWNLAMINSQASIEHVLHAHTRAITDINFSAHHPDILATCAVDSFVHCWDLRHPARPAMTFCDWFAGATQVKWNRQDAHILASTHDKFLRIWDDRRGAYPLRSIEAHDTKIYGVDWNRTEKNNLVTCSLDKTVKFWDYTSDMDNPDLTIRAKFPVWRARHTPFGSALLVMPQRGNHDLHLYSDSLDENKSSDEIARPIHRFEGHENQVKEFLWRARGSITDGVDHREFQLVSWGTDRILRLHRVDENTFRSVGHEKGKAARNKVNITRRNATYRTFRESPPKFRNKSSQGESAGSIRLQDDVGLNSQGPWDCGLDIHPMRSWGGSTMSLAGRGGTQRLETDAISWMRGVKIGKRETNLSDPDQSVASMFFPLLKADRIWDTFELGEEITHVGDKFGKVTFEKIEMSNRSVIVSLTGPWGSEGNLTYVKTRIEFPKSYPEEATPVFTVEKTASMSNETLATIASELQLIADAYLSRQRNSLEAILRYLLGEQNPEEILLLLNQRLDQTDLDLIQDPGASSSDEDDDQPDKYTNTQAQGLEMSDGMITESNSQNKVPSRRACGALWAGDGRLVCFFPVKNRIPSHLSLKNNDRSSRSYNSLFEGFGRFDNRSPVPKKVPSTLETIESDGSDSEVLSVSSSGSSSSSVVFGGPHHHFIHSPAWRGETSETQRAHSVEDSQLSSGGTGPVKSTGPKANLISIHDFRDLLPSKLELTKKYLLGGSICCAHNAEAALKSGDQDLGDAWGFVDLILKEQVPLNIMPHPQKDQSIMVIARTALSQLSRKDSAVDLSFDAVDEKLQTSARGSVKWGRHPFGRWMVEALFRRFEQLADVQMLAMLSCVFSESPYTKYLTVAAKSGEEYGNFQHSPLPYYGARQDIGVSHGYFPSETVAKSLLKPHVPDIPRRPSSRKALSKAHSANSSLGASNSDPMTPFSTGETIPLLFRPRRTLFERTDSQAASISTSPEQQRHTQRSNSNIATAFTASLSRPFSFNASASSSPPTTYSKKRLSPAGSYMGSAPPGVTGGPTSFFNKSFTITEDPRSAYSLSASDAEDEATGPKKPVFNIKLKNQDQFHNDGYAHVPLLDPSQDWRYHAYQQAYAEILCMWDMPIASRKILKYNHLPLDCPPNEQGPGPPVIAIGKITAPDIIPNNQGLTLNLRNQCTNCSTALPLQPSSQPCPVCNKPRTPLTCLFCASIIRGLASPCLSCGHVLHFSCRSILLSVSSSQPLAYDTQSCISGCGCDCASHAVVEVEFPIRRKSSASITVTGNSIIGGFDPADWRDVAQQQPQEQEEDEEVWEDVAYESLARNLAGRYLTPRPSQIWRGGK